MKTLAKLSTALCLLSPVAVSAETASTPVPKEVSNMECLVGAWKGGGLLATGKDTAKLHVTWNCKRTAAQYGVLCTFHVTGIPGMPSYEETDLMGYEPNTQQYHWYSVTNAGETHDHVAAVPSGDALTFVFNGTQAGKPFKEVIDLSFSKDSRHASGKAEQFVDGVSQSVMRVELDKS
jgi:hypothetical protein